MHCSNELAPNHARSASTRMVKTLEHDDSLRIFTVQWNDGTLPNILSLSILSSFTRQAHGILAPNATMAARHNLGYEHTFTHTVYDLLQAIGSATMPTPDFEDGVRNQRVLDAIARSSQSRRWEKTQNW